MNIEAYIRDLPPELQEKARACKSYDELVKLAQQDDVELPDEVLDVVSGGGFICDNITAKQAAPKGLVCPKCKSTKVKLKPSDITSNASSGFIPYEKYKCENCGALLKKKAGGNLTVDIG